jgi:hypothetical protein
MVPIASGNLLVPIFRKVQTTLKFLRKLLPASFRRRSRQLIGSKSARQLLVLFFRKVEGCGVGHKRIGEGQELEPA